MQENDTELLAIVFAARSWCLTRIIFGLRARKNYARGGSSIFRSLNKVLGGGALEIKFGGLKGDNKVWLGPHTLIGNE